MNVTTALRLKVLQNKALRFFGAQSLKKIQPQDYALFRGATEEISVTSLAQKLEPIYMNSFKLY
jgi:hypothetical protein